MKKKKRTAVVWIEWTLIVAAIAGALYMMRPSGEVKLAKKIGQQKDDFIEKYGKDLESVDAEPAPKLNDVPSQKKEVKPTINETANANISYAQHGTGSLLRVKEHLKKNKKKLPLIEKPDFEKPLHLSFHALKRIFEVYRLKAGVFPDVAVEKLNGAAVEISGAVMPVDAVPEDGTLVRFWLSNPVVVMAGCVFCNPPTMADLILVTTPFGDAPLRINREQLFKSVVMIKMKGRMFFGPSKDGKVEYMFKMESNAIYPIN
ncbi:hypothetical protein KAH37_00225 [bacterium]|nr:hypothetical protein [bacterium]